MKISKIIFTLVQLLIFQGLTAQITLMDAKSVQSQNAEGVYYSLPLTVFKVDVDMAITEKIPGPLKQYSQKFLGMSDVIEEESSEYDVIDVQVSPVTIEDKAHTYFIAFVTEKGKDKEPKKQFIELTPNGLLRSFNVKTDDKTPKSAVKDENTRIYIIGEKNDRFAYEAEYNRRMEIDTIIRKITIDTMTINKFLYRTSWVDKTPEERADDAAKEIKKLREYRLNLLTGYHEVNFSGSIRYMDGELKKLEQQYLELFVGKEIKTVRHFTVFYAPNESMLQKEIFKSEVGDRLLVKVSKLGESAVKDVRPPLNNALIYRIPASCEVQVLFNRKNMFDDIFPVNQLGTKASIAVSKIAVAFDPVTGLPVKITRN